MVLMLSHASLTRGIASWNMLMQTESCHRAQILAVSRGSEHRIVIKFQLWHCNLLGLLLSRYDLVLIVLLCHPGLVRLEQL